MIFSHTAIFTTYFYYAFLKGEFPIWEKCFIGDDARKRKLVNIRFGIKLIGRRFHSLLLMVSEDGQLKVSISCNENRKLSALGMNGCVNSLCKKIWVFDGSKIIQKWNDRLMQRSLRLNLSKTNFLRIPMKQAIVIVPSVAVTCRELL